MTPVNAAAAADQPLPSPKYQPPSPSPPVSGNSQPTYLHSHPHHKVVVVNNSEAKTKKEVVIGSVYRPNFTLTEPQLHYSTTPFIYTPDGTDPNHTAHRCCTLNVAERTNTTAGCVPALSPPVSKMLKWRFLERSATSPYPVVTAPPPSPPSDSPGGDEVLRSSTAPSQSSTPRLPSSGRVGGNRINSAALEAEAAAAAAADDAWKARTMPITSSATPSIPILSLLSQPSSRSGGRAPHRTPPPPPSVSSALLSPGSQRGGVSSAESMDSPSRISAAVPSLYGGTTTPSSALPGATLPIHILAAIDKAKRTMTPNGSLVCGSHQAKLTNSSRGGGVKKCKTSQLAITPSSASPASASTPGKGLPMPSIPRSLRPALLTPRRNRTTPAGSPASFSSPPPPWHAAPPHACRPTSPITEAKANHLWHCAAVSGNEAEINRDGDTFISAPAPSALLLPSVPTDASPLLLATASDHHRSGRSTRSRMEREVALESHTLAKILLNAGAGDATQAERMAVKEHQEEREEELTQRLAGFLPQEEPPEEEMLAAYIKAMLPSSPVSGVCHGSMMLSAGSPSSASRSRRRRGSGATATSLSRASPLGRQSLASSSHYGSSSQHPQSRSSCHSPGSTAFPVEMVHLTHIDKLRAAMHLDGDALDALLAAPPVWGTASMGLPAAAAGEDDEEECDGPISKKSSSSFNRYRNQMRQQQNASSTYTPSPSPSPRGNAARRRRVEGTKKKSLSAAELVNPEMTRIDELSDLFLRQLEMAADAAGYSVEKDRERLIGVHAAFQEQRLQQDYLNLHPMHDVVVSTDFDEQWNAMLRRRHGDSKRSGAGASGSGGQSSSPPQRGRQPFRTAAPPPPSTLLPPGGAGHSLFDMSAAWKRRDQQVAQHDMLLETLRRDPAAATAGPPLPTHGDDGGRGTPFSSIGFERGARGINDKHPTSPHEAIVDVLRAGSISSGALGGDHAAATVSPSAAATVPPTSARSAVAMGVEALRQRRVSVVSPAEEESMRLSLSGGAVHRQPSTGAAACQPRTATTLGAGAEEDEELNVEVSLASAVPLLPPPSPCYGAGGSCTTSPAEGSSLQRRESQKSPSSQQGGMSYEDVWAALRQLAGLDTTRKEDSSAVLRETASSRLHHDQLSQLLRLHDSAVDEMEKILHEEEERSVVFNL